MLELALRRQPLHILCLGAHSDDIEIGVGGTLLHWIATGAELHVHWAILAANGERAFEAKASAADFLTGAKKTAIEVHAFRDGYFGYEGAALKDWFEGLKRRVSPDIVFTHAREDAHQDHREVSALTWNSFRDHTILEYEIPKWDGDMRPLNMFVPLPAATVERKIELLERHFGSQRSKDWFDAATFRGLARLRGMECRAAEGFAEAFTVRKSILALA
ncbi:PIG-L deacetylase family protein [Rhodomicrobium lacus]|uniref:PIG-L deacetylase family protein n=1 Tax=Rhodomicrobium lacus TaxID=2498452 RepID=UPI000F8C6327|nr:PIG-L deacetylase family protein [Rhodomicrobium lacus]WKW51615.1 PIG-L deacetylase family protein [Rhodomicrobium lacus]